MLESSPTSTPSNLRGRPSRRPPAFFLLRYSSTVQEASASPRNSPRSRCPLPDLAYPTPGEQTTSPFRPLLWSWLLALAKQGSQAAKSEAVPLTESHPFPQVPTPNNKTLALPGRPPQLTPVSAIFWDRPPPPSAASSSPHVTPPELHCACAAGADALPKIGAEELPVSTGAE